MKINRRYIFIMLVAEMVILGILIVLVGCTTPVPTPTESPIITPIPSPLKPPPADTGGLVVEMNELEKMEEKMDIGIDYGTAAIGGVSLVVLILLVVEGAKRLGITGKASLGLSIGLGVVVLGLFAAIERELVPLGAIPWIEVFVYALGGGLTIGLGASGLYEFLGRTGIVKPRLK